MSTSARMLQLLSLLQTHRFWPGTELSVRLEVSERTLRRDIERLRQISELTSAGIGIEGVRRILELEHRAAALAQRNEELLHEVSALREALRQAVSARAGGRINKLPVLRGPDPGQSVVVWRRGR